MKPAQQIVDALLEADDPKDFLDRHGADFDQETLLEILRREGIRPDQVDGIEVYGMADDGESQERLEQGDPQANKWGVSIHTTDTNRWMFDFDDYNAPTAALEAGQKIHQILQQMQPGQTIHFIDEISPP